MPASDGGEPVRVWDLPTRLGHWLIALLVPFSWWSVTNHHLQWHRWSGYTILGLLIFRLVWGVFGSETARFAGFVRGPRAILAYVKGRGGEIVGHSPLGAISVVAMLSALTLQVTLGLFAVDEDGFDPSPLAKFVDFDTGRAIAKLHHLTFKILLVLIGIHLAAILFYAMRRQNLIGPMITGRRRSLSKTAPGFARPWRVCVALTVAIATAWILSRGFAF